MTISEKILEIIKNELKERKERGLMPMLLTFYRLQKKAYEFGISDKELRSGLNELYRDKKIFVGDTLNDRYIRKL